MQSVFRDIYAPEIFLYPLGDVHIGDKGCDYAKLEQYINWIEAQPDGIPRYAVLMGDWMNVATRASKSSPYEQDLTLDEQLDKSHEILSRIQEWILAAVPGNHELRLADQAGFNPMKHLCERLNVPYLGYSGCVHLRVGDDWRVRGKGRKNTRPKTACPAYTIYMHHTTGGGGKTLGGKINRIQMLQDIVSNADIYIGGHNHFEVAGKTSVYTYDIHKRQMVKHERLFLDSGGFLNWENAYPEQTQMIPGGTGAPRITLSGEKRQIQVNLYMTED